MNAASFCSLTHSFIGFIHPLFGEETVKEGMSTGWVWLLPPHIGHCEGVVCSHNRLFKSSGTSTLRQHRLQLPRLAVSSNLTAPSLAATPLSRMQHVAPAAPQSLPHTPSSRPNAVKNEVCLSLSSQGHPDSEPNLFPLPL